MSAFTPSLKSVVGTSFVALAACLATFSLAGCEREERVLDVQTPGADVAVDRNIDTGEVEIDVEDR